MSRVLLVPVSPKREPLTLASDCDFKLRREALFGPLAGEVPPRLFDLLTVASAVYSCDRLVRRSFQSVLRGPARVLDLTIDVADPEFWSGARVSDLLSELLFILSGDLWRFRFCQGHVPHWQRPLLKRTPATVCLYSGGLDSLAGLAARLHDGLSEVVSVTMAHVGRQRPRVLQQIATLNRHFGERVLPVLVPMALVRPPRLSDQELSQRCRGFIFTALGAAAASIAHADRVEIYESGVGAANVPVMSGMSIAGRTTKGSHPHFLALMTTLASLVLDRPLQFVLPFLRNTKSEVVGLMRSAGLEDLAGTSFSCIHTSRREKGTPKHCGTCAACIGRRQAMVSAGARDPSEGYAIDLFNPDHLALVPSRELLWLKATLMQVSRIERAPGTQLPLQIERYLHQSRVVATHDDLPPWRLLLRRYAAEWRPILGLARDRGAAWTKLMDDEGGGS